MPTWLKHATFYEIYPQSFKDTNADGIGDLQGIIEKLDEIQDLGCNAIWVNPCFTSPFGDAGYDVSDYYSIAPRYGSNEDAKRLFDEVHRRGMHVLLDLVPGHTSIEHPWFKESMKVEKNEYTDRYIWTDGMFVKPQGLGYISGFFPREGTCAVNFFSMQPALNYGYHNPDPNQPWQQPVTAPGPRATLEAMKDVMRFWLKMGCDGFRVDMASSLVKNDDKECTANIALWQEVRAFLDKEFPEAAIISEWGEPDKALKAGFHMDFLLQWSSFHYNDLFRFGEPFFSSRGKGNAAAFAKRYLETLRENKDGMICIPSGNHDTERLGHFHTQEEMKLIFAFLLTVPGAPFVYYGDEIGMRYVENLPSREGGYYRTGARTPMQWNDDINAGFSNAAPDKLYLPLDPAKDRPNLEAQKNDPNSLYHEVKKLIALRNAHEALGNCGEFDFVYAEPHAYPLAYLRSGGDEKLLVVLNPSEKEATFPCDCVPAEVLYRYGEALKAKDGKITVPGCSGHVLKV